MHTGLLCPAMDPARRLGLLAAGAFGIAGLALAGTLLLAVPAGHLAGELVIVGYVAFFAGVFGLVASGVAAVLRTLRRRFRRSGGSGS